MQLGELAGTGAFPAPGFEELSFLGELHDPRVRIPAVSVGYENGSVGSDGDGGRAIEGILARAANDGAELLSLGKLRPVLQQVIGIGLRASGASGNRDDRDDSGQQNDSHSICLWLHSPSFCRKLERDSSARSRENYFNWSCTLAMPALAQASSMGWPPGAPLKPTEPIASSPIMIGTPPPSGITSARLRWPVTSPSAVRFAQSAEVRRNVSAV